MSGSPKKHGLVPDLLPSEPNSLTQPALSKAWKRMFEEPFTWVPAELDSSQPSREFRLPFTSQQFIEAATTRYEKSSNWCGATVSPDGDRQLVQVYGEWQVPVPAAPPHEPTDAPYFSATWIGLDGDRRYLDSSMPQVGTQQDIALSDDGEYDPRYYAWFQWWAPRRIKPEVFTIKGIKVTGGCKVMGLVWAIAPSKVLVLFRNFAPDNQITGFCKEAPLYIPRDEALLRYRPTISGATAEWIVERPSVELEPTKDQPDLNNLPDYGEVEFRHCVAGMAQTPGQATAEKVLTAPRFKRLYEVVKTSSRTRFLSMPRRGANSTELMVKYGGDKGK